MDENGYIAGVIMGVLAYKTLELVVVRQKVSQAFLRGCRLAEGSRTRALRVWSKVIDTLQQEFSFITMLYFLSVFVLLGLVFIAGESPTGDVFLTSKVIAIVTVFTSAFIGVLNVAIECYRTLIEKTS